MSAISIPGIGMRRHDPQRRIGWAGRGRLFSFVPSMTTSFRRIALAVFALVSLMALAGYLFWPRVVEHPVDYKMPGNPGPKIAAAQAAAIVRRERLVEQTVWLKEMEAQQYGRVFEDFWDALNAATNKWDV